VRKVCAHANVADIKCPVAFDAHAHTPPPPPHQPPLTASLESTAARKSRNWLQAVMEYGRSHVPEQRRSKGHMQLTDTFADAASLRSSVWASYFENVYGIDTMRFPFSLSELMYFYSEFLPKSVASSIVLRKQHGAGDHLHTTCSGSTYDLGEVYL